MHVSNKAVTLTGKYFAFYVTVAGECPKSIVTIVTRSGVLTGRSTAPRRLRSHPFSGVMCGHMEHSVDTAIGSVRMTPWMITIVLPFVKAFGGWADLHYSRSFCCP